MKKKETNTTINSITYNLFVSDNMDNLKSTSSCEVFLPSDVITIPLSVPESQRTDSDIKYTISVLF